MSDETDATGERRGAWGVARRASSGHRRAPNSNRKSAVKSAIWPADDTFPATPQAMRKYWLTLGHPKAATGHPERRRLAGHHGALAEFERELIRARTGEGRKRAQERGVRFGRPRKLTVHQRDEALQRLRQRKTQADIARTYNVDLATISRLAAASPFEHGAAVAQ